MLWIGDGCTGLTVTLSQVTLRAKIVQKRHILFVADFVFFEPEGIYSDIVRWKRVFAHTHVAFALVASRAIVNGLLNLILGGAHLKDAALDCDQFTHGNRGRQTCAITRNSGQGGAIRGLTTRRSGRNGRRRQWAGDEGPDQRQGRVCRDCGLCRVRVGGLHGKDSRGWRLTGVRGSGRRAEYLSRRGSSRDHNGSLRRTGHDDDCGCSGDFRLARNAKANVIESIQSKAHYAGAAQAKYNTNDQPLPAAIPCAPS